MRGFSTLELLAVLAILSVAVLVTTSLVSTKLQEGRLRAAASEFAVALRAARMIAVTRGDSVPVTVSAHPANTYEYTDIAGARREVRLPAGLRIVSSDSPILFQPNGGIQAAEPPRTEFVAERGERVIARWTVQTSLGGISTVIPVGVGTPQAPH